MYQQEAAAGALAAVERLLSAVVTRDVETLVAAYEPGPETLVFLEGPRSSTVGGERIAAGWRAWATAPFRLVGRRWTQSPQTLVGDGLVAVCGVLDLDVAGGGPDRVVQVRGTWLLRAGPDWRIAHEHVSLPAADPWGTGDWLPAAGAA